MLFLINNPGIAFILIVVIGFSVWVDRLFDELLK